MNDITLKELNRKRESLQNDIRELVLAFQKETGVEVASVDYARGMPDGSYFVKKHKDAHVRYDGENSEDVIIFVDCNRWAK